MKAGIYCRCSTTDQSVAVQLEQLRAYAKARGFDVAGEYLDHGISGAQAQRPALDQLLKDARRRTFDVLVVARLDRLARSVRHLTALAAELEALGIDLVVLDQGLDTSTPAGRLLFNVLGCIAEFERDLIRERVTAGVKAAKKRGVRFGRPEVLNSDQHRRVARLRANGRTIRDIAETLGVGKGTVGRALETTPRTLPRKSPPPAVPNDP